MATAAQNRSGILAMLAAMLLFVGNDALMKLARAAFPAAQAVTLRTCFAILIALAFVAGSGLYTLHRQRMRSDSRLKPLETQPL